MDTPSHPTNLTSMQPCFCFHRNGHKASKAGRVAKARTEETTDTAPCNTRRLLHNQVLVAWQKIKRVQLQAHSDPKLVPSWHHTQR
jgi:hypothetical protein